MFLPFMVYCKVEIIYSIIFVKNLNTQKLLIFKKCWIYLQVNDLFTLGRLETGLSLVPAENLFVNTKLRFGLS